MNKADLQALNDVAWAEVTHAYGPGRPTTLLTTKFFRSKVATGNIRLNFRIGKALSLSGYKPCRKVLIIVKAHPTTLTVVQVFLKEISPKNIKSQQTSLDLAIDGHGNRIYEKNARYIYIRREPNVDPIQKRLFRRK